MAEVTSGTYLTVIVMDDSETEQMKIVLADFAERNPFPAALFEIAESLDIELPEQSEG